jgi:hypothetical protein
MRLKGALDASLGMVSFAALHAALRRELGPVGGGSGVADECKSPKAIKLSGGVVVLAKLSDEHTPV